MVNLTPRGVALEGILDFAYFPLLSGAYAQLPGVPPFRVTMMLIYTMYVYVLESLRKYINHTDIVIKEIYAI